MIIIRNSGGLGNQLFQYAFGRALAERHGTDLKIDTTVYEHETRGSIRRSHLLFNFNVAEEKATARDIRVCAGYGWALPGFLGKIIRAAEKISVQKFGRGHNDSQPGRGTSVHIEASPQFDPKILTYSHGLFIGNWQSEKYFSNIADTLRNELTLKTWSKAGMRFKTHIETSTNKTPIALHVRRGDYISNPKTFQKHGACSPEYYAAAIAHIKNKVAQPHFFVFSDDIAWVKEHIQMDQAAATFVSGNGLTESEELALMSLCSHHIIANSSYSWWGAWLGGSTGAPEHIVIAPKQWFAIESMNNETADLIPAGWIRM